MKNLLKLGFPVVLTYLGLMAMGLVDLFFVGKIDAVAIGAVGMGNSIFSWFLVFGLGMGSGLEYLVARSHGAKETKKLAQYLKQGLLLALWSGIPLTLLLIFLSSHLEWFGVNAEVIGPAREYSIILSFSLIDAYFFNIFRLFLTSMGITRPGMIMLIFGNILNALIDYMLVLGKWGMPSLGAAGAAWATLISRIAMTIGLGIFVLLWSKKNGDLLPRAKFKYEAKIMGELIRVGLPAAFQMMFEVGVFALATTLAARLSTYDLAAHQIVLNTASLTFMVPLGLSSATAILVGQAVGAKQKREAVQVGWRGFILGVGFMGISCLALLCFPDMILGFFTHDPQVIAVGKSIIIVAALFQLSDGTQTVGTGALRGLGDTQSSMIFNLCGHWLVGLPVGTFLCFYLGWGLQGLWIGLSLGLTVVAAAVLMRWRYQTRQLLS